MRRDGSYALASIEQLIDGYVFSPWHGYVPAGGANPGDDGCYIQLRSRMERTGDVDTEDFAKMLDIERAVAGLNKRYPISAMILTLAMFGWEPSELDRLFGGKLHTPAGKHFDRGIAWCAAWLNGEDPEPAYRGAKPREVSAK